MFLCFPQFMPHILQHQEERRPQQNEMQSDHVSWPGNNRQKMENFSEDQHFYPNNEGLDTSSDSSSTSQSVENL